MIDLYYWPTPNGWKVSIMLAECSFDYRPIAVDISAGEQFRPAYLEVSPNNRIPAIVDSAPTGGGEPVSVFESGSILIYLADKAGRFLPTDLRGRSAVLSWLMWQVGGLGPMAGQNGHFLLYAPERVPYAMQRFADEVCRLYGVLDRRLAATSAFVAGDYSIADMAIFPWVVTHKAQSLDLSDFPHVARWFETIRARPAVVTGMALMRDRRTLNKVAAPTVADLP